MRHFEQFIRFRQAHHQIDDTRMMRAAPAGFDEGVDALYAAGEKCLDVAVLTIARPASDAETVRFAFDEGAEADALHMAFDPYDHDLFGFGHCQRNP